MRLVFCFLAAAAFLLTPLSAFEFTVCSYNCGALSDHYDYIRSVCMHKLIQQRYDEEPDLMDALEKIESAALKILFADDPKANQEWEESDYETSFKQITAHPDSPGSVNAKWRALSEKIVTTYKERPIVIHDPEIRSLLFEHIKDLTRSEKGELSNVWFDAARRVMAKRIFAHELKYDILTLQEADYLDESLFPVEYEVRFDGDVHSVNGIVWKKERFEIVQEIGNVMGRGYVVLLKEKVSGKKILVASGHLTGCNPFTVENSDSERGDKELQALLSIMESVDADLKVIGMDSNVTATHPRLALLKEAGFRVDCAKFLGPTCSNPWQVLDTRIDWIAVKSGNVSNIPVNGVGLNSPQTNMSDHKPIAARISDQV